MRATLGCRERGDRLHRYCLFLLTAGGFNHQSAVVAAIPDEGVVGDSHVSKALTQLADLLIQQSNLKIVAAVFPASL